MWKTIQIQCLDKSLCYYGVDKVIITLQVYDPL